MTSALQQFRIPIALSFVAIAAIAIGVVTVLQPLAAIALVILAVTVVYLGLGTDVPQHFFLSLTVVLVGYAFVGRGFAHLGFPPIFVGELVFAFGLLALVTRLHRVRLTLFHALILGFMVWGFVRTIPYWEIYGFDALRDAVLWAYATFAIVVSLLLQRRQLQMTVDWYRRLVPVFVFWVPMATILTLLGGLFTLPGQDVRFMVIKGGDIAVHLAGAGAFTLIGLWSLRRGVRPLQEFVVWVSWFVSAAVAAMLNRGGMLALLTAMLIASILRPTRHLFTTLMVGTMLVSTVLLVNPVTSYGGEHRELSVDQLTDNVASLLPGVASNPELEGTRRWRMLWWGDIVEYTFRGPYFWTGKEFGVNLATDDGYQLSHEGDLRSPHNGHLSILARSGVPGLTLWFVLNLAFAFMMIRLIVRSAIQGNTYWLQVSTWLFVYWIAMVINASFDVYLEGPQGGIWYWTVIGFGIAAYRVGMESTGAVKVVKHLDDGSWSSSTSLSASVSQREVQDI